MKIGDMVQVRGASRRYVVLPVTQADISRGTDVPVAGLYLFGGYWYGGGPLRHKAYGKVLPLQGRIVGRIRGHYAAKRKCG